MADALTPERQSQESLNRLAGAMGRHTGRQESSGVTDLATSLNIPLLNELIDESGEIRLPMGLTVYDAMGTTSVGFGSKF
jgi:predicted nucleic acid-binding protein